MTVIPAPALIMLGRLRQESGGFLPQKTSSSHLLGGFTNPKSAIHNSKLYYSHIMEPDKTEKRIRFGCGFTFGLVAGFFGAAQHIYYSAGGIAAGAIVTALLCGWFAMKYGDRFWQNLARRWWW